MSEEAGSAQNTTNVVSLQQKPKREQDIEEFMLNVNRIREGLRSIADPDAGIDSGGGLGGYDLWVKVNGSEYYITIAVSNAK